MTFMDYSQYKILEFRRKFFKFFGAEIDITDPNTNRLVGYIKMKAWRMNADVGVYTDKTMQQSIVNIGGRQLISFKPSYSVLDATTQQPIVTLLFRRLRTAFVRGYVDILDNQGNPYGYAKETSSVLAIARRWIEVLPFGDYVGLIFMFVPQTFDIMYAPTGAEPKLAGRIVHRKNPIIVKMSLNTTEAQVAIDPRINIAVCTVLSIRDANKNT
jgi:hypothetical protein